MNLASIIESILFVHGAPLSVAKLAKASGATPAEVRSALAELETAYKDRGIVILKKDDEVEFGTNPENAKFVEALAKSEFTEGLSKASGEVLAIVAYKGPIARSEIEFIRGVNSSFSLRNLMLRGLIERIENPKDHRAFLYRASFDLLKFLGVSSVEELPRYDELKRREIVIPETPPEAGTEAVPSVPAPSEAPGASGEKLE